MSYYNPLHLYLEQEATLHKQPYMGTYRQPVYDWLGQIRPATGKKVFECVEVHFKNGRKEFFKNTDNLALAQGDVVVTEAAIGYDVGTVSLTGELVKLQMRKKKTTNHEALLRIYRKAHQRDIAIWHEAQSKEIAVQKIAREIALSLGLEMKISDVEFQGDGSKATFYYTADERVDFRQLIKDMAREFGVRIEMRQIGFRQEASRLGGIGSCGREVCGSTWMNDFKAITALAARNQQLPSAAQKLSGQCGKQKCCMNFELEVYLDALKDFPKTNIKLQTDKGQLTCQKIDILQRLMWFVQEEEHSPWHKLSVEQVKEIIELNTQGNTPILENYTAKWFSETIPTVSEESINRFDEPKKKSKRSKAKERKSRSEARPSEARRDVTQVKSSAERENKNTTHKTEKPTNEPENQTKNSSKAPRQNGHTKEAQNRDEQGRNNKRRKLHFNKNKKNNEKQAANLS